MTILKTSLTLAVACSAAFPVLADDFGEDPAKYWSLDELSAAPAYRDNPYAESDYPGMRAMLVKGKGPNGSVAEFFAYYAVPSGKAPAGGWPGVVLVHGGGGTAFPNVVADWRDLGFAVIAADWYNQRPAPGATNVPPSEVTVPRRDLAGGRRQNHVANVANAILAHSLLRSFPEVNKDRTVLVGLSWGSWYGACVAAVDDRLKGVVEIYCGDRHPRRGRYTDFVDGRFLPFAKVPMWWTVSTNDDDVTPYTSQAGWEVCARQDGQTIVNALPHSHEGFDFESVRRMAKYYVGAGKRLPKLGEPTVTDGVVSAEVLDPGEGVALAKLAYTTSCQLPTWNRPWTYVPAQTDGRRIWAKLPADAYMYYLAAFERDCRDLCGTTRFLGTVRETLPGVAKVPRQTVSGTTLLRMGPMNLEPKADNVITREEIERSSQQYGLVSTNTGLLAKRYQIAYFGWTDKGVYCAARSSIPQAPQTLNGYDWLELTLLPPGAGEAKRFRRPIGRLLKGMDGIRAWGCPCAETEIFVPFSELGVTDVREGERWGLQIALHFSSAEETACWHLPATEGELGTFIPDRGVPTVGVREFADGNSWRRTGVYNIVYTGYGSAAKPVAVACSNNLHYGINSSKLDNKPEEAMDIRHARIPGLDGVTLEPGAFKVVTDRLKVMWPGTVNVLDSDVRAGGELVYRRRLRWDIAQGLEWHDAIGLPVLTTGFYPSRNGLLRCRVEPKGVKDLVRGGLRVLGGDGKVYWEQALGASPHVTNQLWQTHLPNLPLQDYVVRLVAKDAAGKKYAHERTFAVRKFPWQGNDIGKDDVVIPPFKPIRDTGDGETFTLTGFHDAGLFWDRITAKGENILAAPVTLTLDGREFAVRSRKTLVSKPTRVVREVEAVSASGAGKPAVGLTLTLDYDYDGFCWVTMKFRNEEPVSFSSLRFAAPFKGEHVKYFEPGWDATPRNRMGQDRTLASGDGVAWDALRLLPSNYLDLMHFGLQSYIWFGAVERGFSWITESFVGMEIPSGRPAQRIVRKGDVATFEVDYVARPTTWAAGERTFAFGVQATPVKPVPPGGYKLARDLCAYIAPSNSVRFAMGSNFELWPIHYQRNTAPEGAMDFMKWVRGQKRDVNLYHRKMDECLNAHRDWFAREGVSFDNYRAEISGWWRYMDTAYLCKYVNPIVNTCYWPEWEMYKAEWYGGPWPEDFECTEYGSLFASSLVDHLLWYEQAAIKDGFNGFYYDCFATCPVGNPISRPEGAVLDALGNLKTPGISDFRVWRELTKRTATMCYRNGIMIFDRPLVMLHNTLGNVMPVVSWCAFNLSTENGSNGGDYQDRYTEGYVMANIVGRNCGNIPSFLVSTQMGDDARKGREALSILGFMCAYGLFNMGSDNGTIYNAELDRGWNAVFDFGWAKDDVERIFYYDEGPKPVTHDGRDVRLTVARRGNRALLMFGNLKDAADITFDASGLGRNLSFTDAMTGERLPEPKLHLPRHGYRLVHVAW